MIRLYRDETLVHESAVIDRPFMDALKAELAQASATGDNIEIALSDDEEQYIQITPRRVYQTSKAGELFTGLFMDMLKRGGE